MDLFCGAGGAAGPADRSSGYAKYFDCVGYDIAAQPHYPHEFYQADAIDTVRCLIGGWTVDGRKLADFDAIHASPPCQAYTTMSYRWRGNGGPTDDHPQLIAEVRRLLEATGLPYVIENVEGASRHMATTLALHGGMFGLGVHRPRLFESNVIVLAPSMPTTRDPLAVYGDKPDGRWLNERADGSRQYAAANLEQAQRAMGMDWADWHGTKEAIPPAYTEFIGAQLLAYVERVSA